ncbi:hypothetical protein COLU111180_09475 [Cohnella lubricantis]|nr:hypothetical protein [Cohnella lubricantis]
MGISLKTSGKRKLAAAEDRSGERCEYALLPLDGQGYKTRLRAIHTVKDNRNNVRSGPLPASQYVSFAERRG